LIFCVSAFRQVVQEHLFGDVRKKHLLIVTFSVAFLPKTIKVIARKSTDILIQCVDSLFSLSLVSLWPPCVIGQAVKFLPCGFFLCLSIFFPRPVSAVADWMSAILPHMVWP